MSLQDEVRGLASAARRASAALKRASGEVRDAFLGVLASLLENRVGEIESANRSDLAAGEIAGMAPAMLDRLLLDTRRIGAIAQDLRQLARLPDPLAERFDARTLDSGLQVHKRRVPLGVLGVIYESRPNVTIDVAALAIKTGNAAVLRGGKEAIASNRVLLGIAREALADCGLPADALQFVDRSEREASLALLQQDDLIDLIIPRGGAGLHAFCRQHSRIPVITGGIGICHLYVDRHADLERALPVIRNAKVQRPTVCNALDTVLVHREVAARFVPALVALLGGDGVEFRCDDASLPLADAVPEMRVRPAGPQDFDTEWLALVLGIRVVDDAEAAMAHIERHSSGHSDGILSENPELAATFLERIDSAAVYWNASTRFTDGGALGLGAEVAISTQRLHARGPMGLAELTSYKWVIEGDYHVRC
ncbi:MAG: gamma-glutamyl phosphate reductase [Lysobacterales bacterium]|nr:Gamma-glutamyl phosphate reductase [Xanthomonadales bacterium]